MKSRDVLAAVFPRNDRWILFLIFLLALALRIKGISLLLPYFESGQDERYLVEHALKILKTGDLNPHFVWYGAFPIYWTAMLYGLVLGVRCWVTGGIDAVGECIRDFGMYDQGFLLFYLGRATSIAFGLGTVYLVYLLGRKVLNRETGLLAAFFLSISPLHIYFSQIFKVDASLLFWTLLTFYFAWELYRQGRLRDAIGAGVCGGLSLGTKYNFLSFLPLLAALTAIWARPGADRGKTVKQGLLSLYVGLVVFFVSCPFVLLDFPGFYQGVKSLKANLNLYIYGSAQLYSSLNPLIYRFLVMFPFYFGPLLFLLSLGGGYRILASDLPRGIMFLSFPVSYFFFVSFYVRDLYPQYQYPIFPFVALAGSFALVELLKTGSARLKLAGWAALIFSVLFFLTDLKYPHFYGVYGPYREAAQWVQQKIPRGEKAIFYWWVYTPTGDWGFTDGHGYLRAGDLSPQELKRVDPEWVVLIDAKMFYQTSFATPVWREYRDLLVELKSNSNKSYLLEAGFSPPRPWEMFAGFVHPEFAGFRILIFRKLK
ncbi:MAG: glycosyltransferase family 39 protein [bacterium]|nr:glycosyltransferase family 39 protein [bacterium]